jgi:hypothetical protein
MSRRLKFILVCCMAAWICSLPTLQVMAQSSAPATPSLNANPDISSLETRFFDHTYPQESMDARLDRVERMVFGESKTGSEQDRLTALLLAVPAAPANTAAAGQSTSPTDPSTGQPTTANNGQSSAGNGSQPTADVVTDSSDYPRITQLEQEILGKTFVKEPVQNRLEQLELKAFGKPSATTDLSDRTDALENYADKHFPRQQSNYAETADGGFPSPAGGFPSAAPPYAQSSGYGGYSANPAGTPVATNMLAPQATLDQKVTWLEQQVYGSTSPTLPLLDRVNRLSATIFSADSPQRTQSLADQVSSMVGAVELMPKQQGSASVSQAAPYGQDPQYGAAPFSQYQDQQNSAPESYPNQYAYNPPAQNQLGTQPAPVQKNHSHSFVSGLAHVLGAVGTMAAGSLAGGMMMNGGGMMGGGMMGGGYGRPFGL